MKKSPPSMAMRIVSWTILLLMVAIAVGGLGGYVYSITGVPWWQASLGGLAILVGIVGYILGREAVYKHFCDPLGYHCELRPVKNPCSARDAVELVISGKFRGRPFTLYREIWTSSSLFKGGGSSKASWTVLEWTGDDIQLAKFTREVDTTHSSGAANPQADSPTPAVANKEAGQALMSAADPAGDGVFSKAICDALDQFIVLGSAEAGPGLLVFRQEEVTGRRGFPLPWNIEEFLRQGDEIRRIVMAETR